MGWTEGYFDYKEATPKNEIELDYQDCLNRERGYCQPQHLPLVLFEVPPLSSREAAENYLRDKCGQYWRRKNVGVRYLQIPNFEPNKKMQELSKRISETIVKREKYRTEHSVLNFKAEFIGCPNCKSKLNKAHLKGETCPVCAKDLRSKTTLDTLNGYSLKIKQLKKDVNKEQERLREKSAKHAEVYWLVRAEAYLG